MFAGWKYVSQGEVGLLKIAQFKNKKTGPWGTHDYVVDKVLRKPNGLEKVINLKKRSLLNRVGLVQKISSWV